MKIESSNVATLLLLLGIAFVPTAFGDDVEDVEATVVRFIELLNAGDIDALAPLIAEDYIGYGGVSPLKVDGRDAWVAGQKQFLTMADYVQVATYGPRHIRIHGRTAVVGQDIGAQFWKMKDGPPESSFFNGLSTWVKKGDKWLFASYMSVPLAHGTKP